jgi:hypothetical protein
MYGSDWFMPMPICRQDFLRDFQQVFLSDKMPRVYYRLFFSENALNYLNAKERIGDQAFPIDPSVAATLASLLKSARGEGSAF